jgi:transketolase
VSAAAPAESACRTAYRDTLLELAREDPRVVCLDTDTGLFDGASFAGAAGAYVSVGVAEHTLMGVAAGLALAGYRPFANTFAAFAGARALEAVKLDVAYANVPVVIAATHAGLSAGHLGPTHHALEDVAAMRLLPNMTVLVPGDADQARQTTRAAYAERGPVYLRLDRKPTALLGLGTLPFEVGRAQELRQGDDVTIVASGPLPLRHGLEASELLAERGVGACVLNVHTIAPLDVEALDRAAAQGPLVTVEDHSACGGLGAAVAEHLAVHGATVRRVGVGRSYLDCSGSHENLLRRAGVHPERVVAEALGALGDELPAAR